MLKYNPPMGILQLILFWIFFGLLASHIARRKGRDQILWFIIGLFIGAIGVIALLLLPAVRKPVPMPSIPISIRRPQKSDAWLKLWYYIDPTHEQHGPIEFPDLAKLRKEKRISEKSLIWGEGMQEWKKLADMPELIQEMDS